MPRGAELEVLQSMPVERRGLSLFQVRVRANGGTGYLFLRDSEFDRSCPLIWPSADDAKPSQPIEDGLDSNSCYKRGVFANRKQIFSKECLERDGNAEIPNESPIKLEGGLQAVLTSVGPREEFGLLVQDKKGWRAYSMGDYGSDRHNRGWDAPVRAGRAVYLVLSDIVDYEDEGDVEHSQSYTLYRVFADGRIFPALGLYLNLGVSSEKGACSLQGNADESVAVRCRAGRSQTFRWNAAVNKLVP